MTLAPLVWFSVAGDELTVDVRSRSELDESLISGSFVSIRERARWTVASGVERSQPALGVYEGRRSSAGGLGAAGHHLETSCEVAFWRWMMFEVFVQNEAGSNLKHVHDEKRLTLEDVLEVSCPYPFPYGFVVDTTSDDGLNVDCYVITDHALKTGSLVACEAIGLMEQTEDGEPDHNVLARVAGEDVSVTADVRRQLTDFVLNVFTHGSGRQVSVGRFLGSEEAEAHIARHRYRESEQR